MRFLSPPAEGLGLEDSSFIALADAQSPTAVMGAGSSVFSVTGRDSRDGVSAGAHELVRV